MSFVELNKTNFDNISIRVFPQQYYTSGSSLCLNTNIGEFGCVPAIRTRSKSIKELDNNSNDSFTKDHYQDINRARISGETGVSINPGYHYLFDTYGRLNPAQSDNYFFKIKRSTFEYRDPESRFDKNGNVLTVEEKNDFYCKKNIIKNVFYKKYKSISTINEFYNYGFSNYNSLNFFTLGVHPDYTLDETIAKKTHKTCVVFPNPEGNTYTPDTMKGDNAEYTISFWLNPRRSNVNGFDYNSGTILHIPGLIGVYLVKGTSLNEFGFVDKFRLLLETSTDSYTMPDATMLSNNAATVSDSKLSVITDDNILNKNSWHHISIVYKNKLMRLYVDGKPALENVTNIDDMSPPLAANDFAKTIFIGNRLDYTLSAEWNDNVYNYYFGSDAADEFSCFDNGVVSGRSNAISALSPNLPNFEDALNLNTSLSTALNAEIADLRIYSKVRLEKQIQLDMKEYIEDLTADDQLDILFYLPLYFVPETRKRYVDIIYGTKSNVNITGPVNPYLSHRILGHEVSVEHFLNDFVNKYRPFIEGVGSANLSATSVSGQALTNEHINTKINKAFVSDDTTKNLRQNNHILRNHLILPNDNGLTLPSWKLIENIYPDLKDSIFYKDTNGDTVKGLVSVNEIIDSQRINNTSFDPISLNFRNGSLYRKNRKPDSSINKENISLYGGVNVDDIENEEQALNVLSPLGAIILKPCIFNTQNPIATIPVDEFPLEFRRNLVLYEMTSYIGDTYGPIFEIPNAFYSKKIKEETIELEDLDIAGTAGALQFKLKDNASGGMYRADCLTEHAKWNYVGHVFRSEGFISLLHPSLASFGEISFSAKFKGEHGLNVFEINVPCYTGELNVSQNKSYKKIKPTNYFSDSTEDFVFIDTINLHDENLNIIAKANLSQPLSKRLSDKYNFRLKLDY